MSLNSYMIEKIKTILSQRPQLLAREIASEFGCTRKEVNQILHQNSDIFDKDAEYRWSLVGIVLTLEGSTWITADSFEQSLIDSGYVSPNGILRFNVKLPINCKIMLDATARLLALVNQLAHGGKVVSVDFTDCRVTKSYLDRAGFFDQLHDDIIVSPSRPKKSAAQRYRDNSTTLFEFRTIDLVRGRDRVPTQLADKFVENAGDIYSDAAFTIISELIDNVHEHSKSPIPGFAALQRYEGNNPHIQTVVSDSGLGITSTLKPALAKHYPTLHRKMKLNDIQSDIKLLETALKKGSLSQLGKTGGRGCGLHQSAEFALKYHAHISVRQETFSLQLRYKNGAFEKSIVMKNLPYIAGSHICFDFMLT